MKNHLMIGTTVTVACCGILIYCWRYGNSQKSDKAKAVKKSQEEEQPFTSTVSNELLGGKNKITINIVSHHTQSSVSFAKLHPLYEEGVTTTTTTTTTSQDGENENENENKNVTFVIRFKGDECATDEHLPPWEQLAYHVNRFTQPGDEIILLLESGGGYVSSYGMAASALCGLKKDGQVKLTICVDRVAASGGYMMACVADSIVAAPFAMIGSVGVVCTVPNFRGLADKVGIALHQLTAGDHKRTIDNYGEITEEKIAMAQKELDTTHRLFIEWVDKNRNANGEKMKMTMATGECWYGTEAIKLGLVDSIATSFETVASRTNVYTIQFIKPNKDDNKWIQWVKWVFGVFGK